MAINLLLVGVFVIIMIMMASNHSKRKKKIIFFGDSITEMAVNAGGYISLLREQLKAEGSDDKFQLTGSGIGGDKVNDLHLRMDKDVLLQEPEVVFLFIGVNDVWHKLNGAGTDVEKFETIYREIVQKLTDANIRVILCTPAVIGEKTDRTNEFDADLDLYSDIIRNIATINNIPLVDLRKLFQNYNLEHNPENKEDGILTYDKVHLNEKGNQLIASAFRKELQKLM